MWMQLAFACLCSMVVSLAFTAILRHWLPRFGLTDQPDGRRKTHRRPTPVGGGLAVFLGASTAAVGLVAICPPWRSAVGDAWLSYLGVWVACFLITILGLVDDAVQMRGRQKLLGQAAISLVMISLGIRIDCIEIFGVELAFGIFAVPLTMIWFLGTINALNLLDGIDGLATSIGIIISLSIAVMALLTGSLGVAMLCLVFSTSLMGFLLFNFPPATIFLGDTGSMLIGTLIGALSIIGSFKTPGTVLFAAPLAVFAIPFLDCGAAIIRRKLTGRSLYSPDRDHIHHRLTWRMSNHRTALAWIAVISLLASLGGVVSVYFSNDIIAAITVFTIISILVSFRLFGDSELKLLVQQTTLFGRSFWQHAGTRPTRRPQSSIVRFRGAMPWDRMWETLLDATGKLSLRRVTLNVNLWTLNEVFHAKWTDGNRNASEDEWSVCLPLFLRDGQVGHISATGVRDGQPMCEQLDLLLSLIEPFEEEFRQWCCEVTDEAVAAPSSDSLVQANS